jgi:hypothetical protein
MGQAESAGRGRAYVVSRRLYLEQKARAAETHRHIEPERRLLTLRKTIPKDAASVRRAELRAEVDLERLLAQTHAVLLSHECPDNTEIMIISV